MITEYDFAHAYMGLHFSGLYLPLEFCADCFMGRYVSEAGLRSIGFSFSLRKPGGGYGYGFSKYFKV